MPNLYQRTINRAGRFLGLSRSDPAADAIPAPAKPDAGEASGNQGKPNFGGGAFSSSSVPGFGVRPKAEYDTYDKVDADDTVALVRSTVESPILAAGQKFVKANDAVPDEWLKAVEDAFQPLMLDLIRDCLSSGFSYGFAPFEIVWADDLSRPERFKPLRPQITDFLVDESGRPRALVNRPVAGGRAVDLIGAKAFWWTYKGRFGDPYGTSRHEPILSAWHQKNQMIERLGQYARKVCGVTVQLHYPDGVSRDASGVEYPNYYLGKMLLDAVARGEPVMFQNRYAAMAEENPREAADLAGKSDWVLSGVDLGGSGDFSKGILEGIDACNRRIVRGWLRPERSVLEAEHGSRADAQQHTETGTIESQLVANDICQAISKGGIDIFLVMLFGERARGAVRVESNPINDNRPKLLLDLVTAAMSNPILAVDVWQRLNRDVMLDQADLPMITPPNGKPTETIPDGGKLLPGPTPPGGDDAPPPKDRGDDADMSRFKPAWRQRFERHAAAGTGAVEELRR